MSQKTYLPPYALPPRILGAWGALLQRLLKTDCCRILRRQFPFFWMVYTNLN